MTLSNQELAHAANDVRNEGSDVAAAIVDDLVLRIDEPPPFVGLKELLDALRSNRCFAALGRLADAVIASGASYAYVRHQHAQALIEQGHLTMAKLVLNDLLRDIDTGAPLADVENGKKRLESRSEAVGLLARTSKQQFVRLAHNREEAQTHLERAIAYYGEVYPLDRAWHGANLVALRRRAEQEGWKLRARRRERPRSAC